MRSNGTAILRNILNTRLEMKRDTVREHNMMDYFVSPNWSKSLIGCHMIGCCLWMLQMVGRMTMHARLIVFHKHKISQAVFFFGWPLCSFFCVLLCLLWNNTYNNLFVCAEKLRKWKQNKGFSRLQKCIIQYILRCFFSFPVLY